MKGSGSIDKDSIINNNTYYTNRGVSMTHIINGAAGNIESHSTLDKDKKPLKITAFLDFEHFGFIKLKVFNATTLSFSYIEGDDGSVRDELTLIKRGSDTSDSSSTINPSSGTSTDTVPSSSSSKKPNGARCGCASVRFGIALGVLAFWLISF